MTDKKEPSRKRTKTDSESSVKAAESKTVECVYENSVKNSVRFKETEKDGIFGTVYIKNAFAKDYKRLRITVEFLDE
ncbi:hypothetical protein SARC_05936 [Sphaeroforma arctica JP610]|uniref:Uncharacterized protein n=1 Tax=Sphaeroforma arctica JP610 TaxID=667725 RepID=A0A0L0FYW5_9EUKA|nr:hypothetical protein SARC_05936 [Sphaeroforma arctica JP610]KNC81751.1 hypothetical protein SARC_05936 [Sphaeroforma arctica JP610]|eukprot:XP_014155653.1 hypothetical protein SARC_05936 [Sphaeroforma arctica JP610]